MTRGRVVASVLLLISSAALADGLTLGGRLDVGPQAIDNGTSTQTRIDSGTYVASRLILPHLLPGAHLRFVHVDHHLFQ